MPQQPLPDPNMKDENPKIVEVNKPRITVIDKVYHQVPGQTVVSPESGRFYRWIESDDQAYRRTVKVGIKWEPIDQGWFEGKEQSLLIIANDIKRLPSRRPTQDEIDEFNARVLEVGIEVGGYVMTIASIRVGEDMRICPLNLDSYRIRCKTTDSKYSIFLVGA